MKKMEERRKRKGEGMWEGRGTEIIGFPFRLCGVHITCLSLQSRAREEMKVRMMVSRASFKIGVLVVNLPYSSPVPTEGAG